MAEQILNPAIDPWWESRLIWYLENNPQLVKKLFLENQKELRGMLDRDVESAAEARRLLVKQGRNPIEVKNLIFETMIAPQPEDEKEQEKLPEALERRIMSWANQEEAKDAELAETS